MIPDEALLGCDVGDAAADVVFEFLGVGLVGVFEGAGGEIFGEDVAVLALGDALMVWVQVVLVLEVLFELLSEVFDELFAFVGLGRFGWLGLSLHELLGFAFC